jgi:hypothetical protein
MTDAQRLRLVAIEEDLREQAVGEQCGFLLELANRFKAVLVEIDPNTQAARKARVDDAMFSPLFRL